MPIAAPTIDMIATGANIKALIKDKGLKVTDVQTVFGFNTPQAIFKWMRGDAIGGTVDKPLTDQGKINGDVDWTTKGLTSNDALRIQEYLLHKITSLEVV